MTGYHVYTQFDDNPPYNCIDNTILLLSILSWKKYFGDIHLYCNQKYLDNISEWGLEKEYASINILEIEQNIPFKEHLSEYFAFPKIYITKLLSEKNQPFALVDTDLWINSQFDIPMVDMLFYHDEMISYDEKTDYISPEYFIDNDILNSFSWSANPINASLIFYNNNYNHVINEWYNLVVKIIDRNKNKFSEITKSIKMTFLEQRLFAELIKKHNIKYDFILHSTYLPHEDGTIGDGREWSPNILYSETLQKESNLLKHIWGIKNHYDNIFIRETVVKILLKNLGQFHQFNFRYEKLVKNIQELISN